ncbi:MAG: hypothetical protein K9G67_15615 [Bacteroidales bacterium]|nr:hypothetical protein [Bacteroidales bacterium]MCF8351690.1 hypothetical protein [Bacteroidales bacterium]MCF8377784.1 hypothetical protein [Bacteroidales bacterium]
MKSEFGFRTNIFADAKKDLRRGEVLNGIGGYTIYGLLENYSEFNDNRDLPVCLAENVILEKDLAKDNRILMTDVKIPDKRFDFQLYSESTRLSGRSFRIASLLCRKPLIPFITNLFINNH